MADTPDTVADTLAPPEPQDAGMPAPSADDPTAGGYYCGSRRSPAQIRAAMEAGDADPWPWCRNRAGKGTDHAGVGRCRHHAGNTPQGRAAARLRGAELLGPAVATFATIMVDTTAPRHARLRAAENIADRFGMPRKQQIDVDSAREDLVERLAALVEAGDADN